MTRSRRCHIQRNGFAAELCECSRGCFKEFSATSHFKPGHPNRLANVSADRRGEIIGVIQQGLRRGSEPADPHMHGLFAMPAKGSAGGMNGLVDSNFSGLGDFADDLSILRSDQVKRAGGVFDGFPVDEAG
jgi:hypothetical protein